MHFSIYSRCLILFLLLVFICEYNLVHAQQVYNHRIYNESDGMLSSDITGITQTPDGIVWVSTILGISRYDGSKWENFSNVEYDLPKGMSTRIDCSNDGVIWVAGFKNGEIIVRFWQDKKWNSLISNPSFSQKRIYSYHNFSFDVYKGEDALKIVIGCEDIFEYTAQTQTWELIHKKENKKLVVNKVKYDAEGKLWLATNKGLKNRHNNQLRQIPYKANSNLNIPIYAITFSHNNGISYVLGNNWIGKITKDTIEKISNYSSEYIFDLQNYSNIILNKNGDIIFNGFSSVFFYKDNKVAQLLFNHELSTSIRNRVLFIDKEDNLWIGSGRGLIKLNTQHFTSYNRLSGFKEDEVSALLEIKESKQVVIGHNKSISFFARDTIINKVINRKSVVDNVRILKILQGTDGNIYFAANAKGLGIWDKKSAVKWYASPDNRLRLVSEIFEYNNVIYALSAGIFYKLNDDRSFSEVLVAPGNVRKVQVLNNGQVLVLGHHIYEFKDETLVKKYELVDPYKKSLYGVCEWNNRLLVATRQGLQEAKRDSIRPVVINNYPIRHPVYALLVDSRNNLWVGTSKGVYQFIGNTVYHYQQSNGLIGNEINRNALIEDREGKIWIGTDKGVSIFNYGDNHENFPLPVVKIKSIRTDEGRDLSCSDSVRLKATENDLEFSFVGVSFMNEEKINYRFRLLGNNDKWQYLPSNYFPNIRYTNLTYGTYQFELQARNGEKQWTNSIYSGKIYIKRPFLKSPLFYVIVVLIAVGFGVVAQILFSQRSVQLQLKTQVAEKTLELSKSENQLRIKNNELEEIHTELKKSIKKEKELNLMKSKFVNTVSHQFRTPLTVIKSNAEIIDLLIKQQNNTLFNRLKKPVNRINKESDRMRVLMDDFLMLEKIQSGTIKISRTPVQLQDLSTELTNSLNSSKKYDSRISLTILGIPQEILVDENLLYHILMNLLDNAQKYSVNKKEVLFQVSFAVENILITIQDYGIGIPSEDLEKIFTPFYRSNNTDEISGTGLGMSIALEYVELLNGTIKLESVINEGTIVRLVLPYN